MKTRNMFQLSTVLVAVLALVHGLPILAAAQQSRIPDLSGKVLTVRGPIEPGELGKTLMHEHILIDFQKPAHLTGVTRGQHRDITAATDWGLFFEPVSLKNLSAVRNGVAPNRDNLDLSDIDVAIDEVLHFKRWGGATIVDVTSIGLGRDPNALLRVANATGLNIVMGAGYYQKQFHPPDMGERTVEELTDVIIADVTVGADGTSVRSGIIGEVGIDGNPLDSDEIKSIRAAARASRATGAAISFHVGGYMEEKFTVIDTVAAEGGDITRVIMGHSNSIANNVPFMKRVLERGVYLQFDTLGRMGSRLGTVDDGKVAQGIVELVDAGYEDRILLSQDVCHKIEIKKYGGTGFSYILEFVLPELKRRGVTERQMYKMMVENPARVLTFAKPAPPLSSSAAGG